MFYDTKREYFSNCIIYKYDNIHDDKYYKYGALQLLYLYCKTKDSSEKQLIIDTYNDKIKNNSLNLTHSVNLDKLQRNDLHLDKKINLSTIDDGDTEWAKCYFTEGSEGITTSLNSQQLNDNEVYFNRIDKTTLCNNIHNFIDNTESVSSQDKILLKIRLEPLQLETNLVQPETIQIFDIRIVKYSQDSKKITEYDTENYFINYFFKLDVDTELFIPIKQQVTFYKFNNLFCDNLYNIEKIISDKCFNINQLGFESIRFSDNDAQFSETRILETDTLFCNDDRDIEDMDMVKQRLKNNLLNTSRNDYNKCDEKIRLTQAKDRDLRKHRRDKCVNRNVYNLDHCKYKSNCLYHDIHCNYEKDRAKIKRFKTLLNDSKDISNIETNTANFDLMANDSNTTYEICSNSKYKNKNIVNFYEKYDKYDKLETMKDNTLNNFDNNSELYIDFEMLQYVSQDNSIYIFIDNK